MLTAALAAAKRHIFVSETPLAVECIEKSAALFGVQARRERRQHDHLGRGIVSESVVRGVISSMRRGKSIKPMTACHRHVRHRLRRISRPRNALAHGMR